MDVIVTLDNGTKIEALNVQPGDKLDFADGVNDFSITAEKSTRPEPA